MVALEYFDADKFEQVEAFVMRLDSLTYPQKVSFGGLCLTEGLMKAKGVFWLTKTIVQIIKGKHGVFNFLAILSASSPQIFQGFWDQTIEHILYGHDTEDVDSVGGWSQREINMATRWLLELERGS